MDRLNRIVCASAMACGCDNERTALVENSQSKSETITGTETSFLERLQAMRVSLDVQHVEANRKQGARARRKVKTTHCALRDGSLRYADKPFTTQRTRAYSPELLKFYADLEMMGLTR